MLKCVFSKQAAMLGVTPVDNIFLCEYMPKAPEGYVKAYLYGLMQCSEPYADSEDMEKALGCTSEFLEEAFAYWQRAGLVSIIAGSPLTVNYLSPYRMGREASTGVPTQERRELVEELSKIFGTRALSGNELRHIFDWIDVFSFEEGAVKELCAYCAAKKGARVSINYMDAVAKAWADIGVTTLEKAKKHVVEESETTGGAQKLLGHLRISRRATADELALYEKWTKGWGFDEESIFALCAQMTGAQRPSFKYLDTVLESYRRNGSVKPEDIDKYLKRRDAANELARLILKRAAVDRAPRGQEAEEVERWLNAWEMEPEALLYAAELCQNESSPFSRIRTLVTDWHAAGVRHMADAREYTEKNGVFKAKRRQKQKPNELKYPQRQISDADYDDIFIDFDDEGSD